MNTSYFIALIIAVFLLTRIEAFSQESMVPPAVPYNNSFSVVNDVDLFTGKFRTSLNLASIGSGQVFFNLTALYNSLGAENAEHSETEDNYKYQSSWAGLGWLINVPGIYVKSYGDDAISIADDEYILIDINGQNNWLKSEESGYSTTTTFFSEKEPFYKITAQSAQPGQEPDLWKIVDANGIIYTFEHELKHWIWQLSAIPGQYVYNQATYRWDITSIKDQFGNEIIFSYNAYSRNFTTPWSTTESYHYQSYLNRVDNDKGEYILINTAERPNPPNPAVNSEQPFYSTRKITTVESYNRHDDLLDKKELTVNQQSFGGNNKLVLEQLKQLPNSLNTSLPATRFEYRANAGELEKIVYPDGGEKEIVYVNDVSGVSVSQIKIFDKLSPEVITTNFTFDQNTVDFYSPYNDQSNPSNIVYKNSSVIFSGNGKINYEHLTPYYDSYELSGRLKEKKVFKENDNINPIKTESYTYSKQDINDIAYFIKLDNVTISESGVVNTTDFEYNMGNGLIKKQTSYDSKGDAHVIFTNYHFGSNDDISLKNEFISKNMLNTVYAKWKTSSDTNTVYSKAWNDYQLDSNNWLIPHKTYKWKGDGSLNDHSAPEHPTSEALQLSEVKSLTTDGLVKERTSGPDSQNEIWGTSKYTATDRYSYAAFGNAKDNETFASSMEYDANSDGLTDGFTKFGSGVTTTRPTNDKRAGKYAQKATIVNSPGSAGIKLVMNHLDNSKEYVLQYDYKVLAGAMSVSIGMLATSHSGNSWQHNFWKFSGSESEIIFSNEGSFVLFLLENVMVYPVDASATLRTFDPMTGQVTATVNTDGLVTRSEYDDFYRIEKVYDDDGNQRSEYAYYHSRTSDASNFNPASPNYTEVKTWSDASNYATSRLYTDGLGRAVQSVATDINGATASVMVSETVYNEHGQAIVTTKPLRYNSSNLSYRPNLLNETNWTPGTDPLTSSSDLYGFYNRPGLPSHNPQFPYVQTEFSNDPMGRVIKSAKPGNTFKLSGGHVQTRVYGGESAAEYGYGANTLFKVSTTGEDGIMSEIYSDKFGRNVATVAASNKSESRTTQYEYDFMGRLKKIIPPLGAAYTSEAVYNTLGQAISQDTPDKGTTESWYDDNGRLRFSLDEKDRALAIKEYQYVKYDKRGRITESGVVAYNGSDLQIKANENDWPNGSTTRKWKTVYSYDFSDDSSLKYVFGRLFKMDVYNENSQSITFSEKYGYDKYGRLVHKKSKQNNYDGVWRSLQFSYDLSGNPVTITYPDGAVVSYHYDTHNKLLSVGNGSVDNHYAEYGYNDDGQVACEKGGKKTSGWANENYYRYTALGQLKDINGGSLDGSEVFAEELSYLNCGWDGASNYNLAYYNGRLAGVKSQLKDLSNNTQTLDYHNNVDAIGQLLGTATGSTNNWKMIASYDAHGNTQTLKRYNGSGTLTQNIDYTYAANKNQLASVLYNASAKTFSYDLNGAMLSDNLNKNRATQYNPLSLPTYMDVRANTSQDAKDLNFSYNHSGLRVYKSYDHFEQMGMLGVWFYDKTRYVRNGLKVYMEYEKNIQGNNEVNNSNRKYIYGLSGKMAVIEGSSTLYFIKDHLGSTRVMVDDQGVVKAAFDYYPFGKILRSWVNENSMYRYTGQEVDEESGYANYNLRQYNTTLGRFNSVDWLMYPFWGSYSYVFNAPQMYVDPTGLGGDETGGDEDGDSWDGSTFHLSVTFQVPHWWTEPTGEMYYVPYARYAGLGHYGVQYYSYSGNGSASRYCSSTGRRSARSSSNRSSENDLGPDWLSYIPVIGSGRDAYRSFNNGSYWTTAFYAGMAISDVFLVKSLVTAVGKASFHFAWKSGSHTWNATRRWLGKNGFVQKGQPVHHWLITQRMIRSNPRLLSVANQPWNLMPMRSQPFHNALHNEFSSFYRFLYGTPAYFKTGVFGSFSYSARYFSY